MEDKCSHEDQDKSFLPEQIRKLLHYWFVQYNPLYFFSALCILFGMFLISRGLTELGWQQGQLLLTAAMQLYEILLIIGGALLFRMAGLRRPAVILGLMEVFFLFDCTFQTEMMSTLGLFGLITGAGWLAMVALKLSAIIWVFRLKVSASVLIVPVLSALAIAGVPHALEFAKSYKIMVHLIATWYGVALMAFVLSIRPKVESATTLDDWGQTVLRRSTKTALVMWAGFYLFHLLTWEQMFSIALTEAHVAPFFLFWFLSKREIFSWTGGLIIIALTSAVPPTVASTALLIGVAYGLKAREIRRYRLYVAMVVCVYIAIWTIGWQGGALPEPNLWLNFTIAVILLAMAWRWRLPSAFLAVIVVLLPGAEALIPHGPLQWGIVILGAGFIALIVGIVINLRQKKATESWRNKSH